MGRSHRLRIVAAGAPVELEDGPAGWLRLHTDHAGDATALITWYSQRGIAWINNPSLFQQTGHYWQNRCGIHTPVTYRAVDLGETLAKVRLGSTPQVILHWAVFQLESTAVKFLLLRELCHVAAGRRLGQAEHQRLLHMHMPGWSETDRRMRKEWRRTWIGAVASRPRPETPCG